MTLVGVTFWLAVALVSYTYLGYPALVWILARLCPRPVRAGRFTPTITVLIAAHNEETRIGAKIENCLALDYPPQYLDIIVVSDGSTDRTPSVVETYASRFPGRVTSVSLPDRCGKASALNAGAAQARGELLLLADARQYFDPRVAEALAQNFADPEVGAASGELILRANAEDRQGTGLGMYWRYEKAIRQAESRAGSSIGYTGAVSAVRRSLFWPLSPDVLLDDLVIALRVISRGHRVVFEPAAKAFDSVSAIPGHEFARKVRTLAGVLQTCVEVRYLAGPLRLRIWWQFLSHKLLRLAVPYALVAALGASIALSGPGYRFALLGQIAGYGLGVLGLVTARRGWWGRVVALPSTFLMLNAAAVAGAFYYVSGRRLDLWRPVSSRADGGTSHLQRAHGGRPGSQSTEHIA